MTASNLSIPLEEIPVRLRCSMCNNLAQDAYRLPCCEQSICGSCQSNLPTVCKICDHSPLDAAECKVYASLRTTVTIFLRTAEKKYGSLAKVKKEATPTPQPPAEKPANTPADRSASEPTREASLPAQADKESSVEVTEDKDVPKPEEQNGISVKEHEQDITENATQNQNTQGTSDGINSQTGGQFWNNQQGMGQYLDQNGQYQGYNMGWNGYDQSPGYGMQGAWGNGMQNMMDQSGAMNSFNGMQSFPDGFNGMGNMSMGYGYGQGGYGNTGMGMQGQGNWGNGWNMQNGLDGSSFNSSGMNAAGFYPGAGGYNHQSSYGNHQSQQNQMMPHQQFQSRGYHHNQYRNYSNQSMRGNYGQQQQQFGGPRGNNRNYEQQPSGNDVSGASYGVNGDGSEQKVTTNGEPPQINSRARGDAEKVLVDEVSDDQAGNKDSQDSMSSETNGATNAISSIDIKGDSQTTESTDTSGTVVKENPYQIPAGDVEPQPQAPVNAPTGPRAMRERSERGRGRGRGGFYGGRGGFHQTQVTGSDEAPVNHLRTGSITSSGKNGTAAVGPDSDYDGASRRQSKADDAQFSPVESRKDQELHDRDRRRSRSRSRSRTKKHRHHRSRSRKRSSSPRQSRVASRDRTRSRSRDRKRHRDGDREKDRDREKERRDKESSRSHRSHKSSSHRHRRDRSRSRSRDKRDAKERDEATADIDAKDTEKILDTDTKSRHRDRDSDDRRKDKEGSRDDRRRDNDKKSRKRSRSRHRSHGHHKRSRGDDEERSDRHGDDPERKSKSSRSSRRHSTRYEDEETAAERERRVEREREEERWGKR